MQLLTKASYDSNPNQRELRNLKVAYEAACESIVLLKNDGILPFSHKKIALYGAGASMTIKGGPTLQGVKTGKISSEDVRRCCGNVVKSIMDSAIQKEYIR